ncbi:hypothetical protein GGI04_004304 [Coemansia thaxteri]|uniref:Peroxin-7 n=1 Tax=Coemansia thaxteri TaxID=2663907 RepID=A0A9W8BF88_9FUNG|nr:hypothetical protein GGI04_004304 [Coemansia thaxteri]KAJ2004920.1 hypothetical protein H4R26_002230 [Coemansia thaxteri]KAJ2463609.1 hypothetical protein GGI02_005202 [Coemansia sp. RSA 2322]KAJ2481525.1 hypothetical protein EV174_003455 [Coemansia sp. RSA 2320]
MVASNGPHMSVYDQRAAGVVSHTDSPALISRFTTSGSEVQALSARGDFVAFVDEDGHAGVCDIADDPSVSLSLFAGGHDALAGCVVLHPEMPVMASGGFDCQMLVWDLASETTTSAFLAGSVSGADSPIISQQLINPPFCYALDFAPADTGVNQLMRVVSGHADGRLLCLSDEAVLCWPDCHRYSISALKFVCTRPDILATASLDCSLALWDADSILHPDIGAARSDGANMVVLDKPPRLLAREELGAKPDTLVSSEITPTIYTDQGCDIVSYLIA